MNDSFRTNVFVQYHPETIGCACIYLAARQLQVSYLAFIIYSVNFRPRTRTFGIYQFYYFHLQVALPNNPPWYTIFDVTEDEIHDICLNILKLYARPKVSSTLCNKYQKTRYWK